MKTINNFLVTVTYMAGLGSFEVPDDVFNQLKEAEENSGMVDEFKYPEAYEWLCDNIKERDSFRWEAEVNDFHVGTHEITQP